MVRVRAHRRKGTKGVTAHNRVKTTYLRKTERHKYFNRWLARIRTLEKQGYTVQRWHDTAKNRYVLWAFK